MMSEQIIQTLGFDAAAAISALSALDSAFIKLGSVIGELPATFSAFNSSAATTVGTLDLIATRANAAADALNRLNSIRPRSGTAAGAPGGAGAAAGAAAVTGANAALGGTASNAAAAANAVNSLGTTFTQAATRGGGFAISLETLTRVLGTQVLVAAIGSFKRAIEGSFDSFLKFNTTR